MQKSQDHNILRSCQAVAIKLTTPWLQHDIEEFADLPRLMEMLSRTKEIHLQTEERVIRTRITITRSWILLDNAQDGQRLVHWCLPRLYCGLEEGGNSL